MKDGGRRVGERLEDGGKSRTKECRRLLAAEAGKELDSSLEPWGRSAAPLIL